MKLWGGRFAEPLDVVPCQIHFVEPGSVCRLWFMPNDSHFVVIGNKPDRTVVVLPDGQSSGFQSHALVVVVSPPPTIFTDLLPVISAHQRLLKDMAWGDRTPN